MSDGQFLMNRSFAGLSWAVKGLLWLVVFSPLIFLSYWIDCQFINMKDGGLTWLLAILVTTLFVYAALFLAKGLIIGLRRRRSSWWIPLFIICIALTCILPAWIMFHPLNYLTRHLLPLTWLLDIGFAYFVYGQYNFLNQPLPFFKR